VPTPKPTPSKRIALHSHFLKRHLG
jgi:hypothetical protein